MAQIFIDKYKNIMANQTSIRRTQDITVADGQVSEVKKETKVTRQTNNPKSNQVKKPKKQTTEQVKIEVDHD